MNKKENLEIIEGGDDFIFEVLTLLETTQGTIWGPRILSLTVRVSSTSPLCAS